MAIGLLQSCGEIPQQSALSSSGKGNSLSSSVYMWTSTTFPINMVAYNDISNDNTHELNNEINLINRAISNWESSLNNTDLINITHYPNTTAPTKNTANDYRDNEMGIYFIQNWSEKELPSSALAVTQIYGVQTTSTTVVMTHADILINNSGLFTFNSRLSNPDSSFLLARSYDFETVILHELGHFLGLKHQGTSTNDSVMYPSIGTGEYNTTPTGLDNSTLNSIYSNSSTNSTTSPIMAYLSSALSSFTTSTDDDFFTEEDEGFEQKDVYVQIELRADKTEVMKTYHKVDDKWILQEEGPCPLHHEH